MAESGDAFERLRQADAAVHAAYQAKIDAAKRETDQLVELAVEGEKIKLSDLRSDIAIALMYAVSPKVAVGLNTPEEAAVLEIAEYISNQASGEITRADLMAIVDKHRPRNKEHLNQKSQLRKPCDEYWFKLIEASQVPFSSDTAEWEKQAMQDAIAGKIDHGEFRALMLSRYMTELQQLRATKDKKHSSRIQHLVKVIKNLKAGKTFKLSKTAKEELPETDPKEIYTGGLRSGFMINSVPFVEEALLLLGAEGISLIELRCALRDGFVNRLARHADDSWPKKIWNFHRHIRTLESGKMLDYTPRGTYGYNIPASGLGFSLPPVVENKALASSI